jgi:hypothetical protein
VKSILCLCALPCSHGVASCAAEAPLLDKAGVEWPVQTLFYKPRSQRTGNMWDTWLYHHDGTHYLYTLAKSRGQWDNIALATSPDGVHWREIGSILRKGRGVTWRGTGSTWRAPAGAAGAPFQMNFSEWKGPRQDRLSGRRRRAYHRRLALRVDWRPRTPERGSVRAWGRA